MAPFKMRPTQLKNERQHNYMVLVAVCALALGLVEQVSTVPVDSSNQWPSFPRRNIAALARGGYLRNPTRDEFKRSLSTLAKNGQLPTFRSPNDETDKNEQEEEESTEKRNLASVARLKSYVNAKRNIQALARDGYRFGRSNQQNNKRNIASLARNGMLIYKRGNVNEDEYFYPFYQNSIPPLNEVEGPLDFSEIYDLQQSINPDLFPPLSQVFKRDNPFYSQSEEPMNINVLDQEDSYYKRSSAGLPVHGLYRPFYVDPNGRSKRYILSLPDVIEKNDVPNSESDDNENEDKRSVDDEIETRDNYEKRHIGSLARLGLLPSFRFSGGRYSRSGRARLLLPSQELYRKHTSDENFGISLKENVANELQCKKYFVSPEAESAVDDTDDPDISPQTIPTHSHPTGRILHRPLNNDLLPTSSRPLPSPPLKSINHLDALSKNRWQSQKDVPKFYYFRSLKVPHQNSRKRYLLLPAVDNFLLRQNHPKYNSLPSRRKNQ